jgi:ATP-dependent DNA helicase RecG
MRRRAMPPGTTTIPVDSSWIESVTYASDATLIVRFRRGSVYRYFTVPRAILEGFLTAPSKGAYFTHRIRNAFPHTQLVEPPTRS